VSRRVPGMDVKRPRGAPPGGFSRAVKGKGPKKTPRAEGSAPDARVEAKRSVESREGTPVEASAGRKNPSPV
jgi:hypothetical protein